MSKTTLERHLDARAEVDATVATHARAIADCITAARAAALYPDGLTVNLQRALSVNQMLAIELGPKPEPVDDAPVPAIVEPNA